jgi:outer membrane protein assembly factor BamB
MIVADGLVYLAIQGGVGNDCVFDADDGRLLGMPQLRGARNNPNKPTKYMILDGSLLNRNVAHDPATGERTGEVPSPAGTFWCGRVTYAPGTGVLGHSSLNFKSPCSVGAWVAGGVLTYFPCIGDGSPSPGAAGFVSGAELIERAVKHPEHPLVKGPAFAEATANGPGSVRAAPGDWVAYRGDAGHRGFSRAAVAREAAIAWESEPLAAFSYSTLYNKFVSAFDDRPAPPLCVGERVFSAGSDGIVTARSLATGKELWSFCAGGPVMCSPTWSGGMLFVPGADGWVYALDAASGRLAWKRRLAPFERRILMFDQLVSTWPVLSLVVDGETVYAAAGHNATEGVKTFALDARTGGVVWSHLDEPAEDRFQSYPQPPDRPVQGIGGSMCLVGDRVWAAGYYSVPLTLDKANGKDHLAELKDKHITNQGTFMAMRRYLFQRGRDVVRIDDTMVLAGGGDLFENHHIRAKEEPRNRVIYRLYYCNEDGDWQLEPAPRKVLLSRIAPACDGELLVCAGPPTYEERKGKIMSTKNAGLATLGLSVWSMADFRAAADAMQKSPFVVRGENNRRVGLKADFDFFKYDGAAWQKPDLDVNALALTKNTVLVAHATGRESTKPTLKPTEAQARQASFRYDGWRVTAFSRDGKETLWEVDLPSEPLYNGLAIAADGSVVVALRDGSILCVRDE